MEVKAFLKRVGMTQKDLAEKVGIASENVSKWNKGKGVPSYEVCRKLLLNGMLVEELFGVEYAKIHGYSKDGEHGKDEDFRDRFRRFREELKGQIDAFNAMSREIGVQELEPWQK